MAPRDDRKCQHEISRHTSDDVNTEDKQQQVVPNQSLADLKQTHRLSERHRQDGRKGACMWADRAWPSWFAWYYFQVFSWLVGLPCVFVSCDAGILESRSDAGSFERHTQHEPCRMTCCHGNACSVGSERGRYACLARKMKVAVYEGLRMILTTIWLYLCISKPALSLKKCKFRKMCALPLHRPLLMRMQRSSLSRSWLGAYYKLHLQKGGMKLFSIETCRFSCEWGTR